MDREHFAEILIRKVFMDLFSIDMCMNIHVYCTCTYVYVFNVFRNNMKRMNFSYKYDHIIN